LQGCGAADGWPAELLSVLTPPVCVCPSSEPGLRAYAKWTNTPNLWWLQFEKLAPQPRPALPLRLPERDPRCFMFRSSAHDNHQKKKKKKLNFLFRPALSFVHNWRKTLSECLNPGPSNGRSLCALHGVHFQSKVSFVLAVPEILQKDGHVVRASMDSGSI